jgi:hypothetical protein
MTTEGAHTMNRLITRPTASQVLADEYAAYHGLDADFIEADWDALDRITATLEADLDLTPSRVARKAKVDRNHVYSLLGWMVAHQLAHTSGNGAWTHYHPGRVA